MARESEIEIFADGSIGFWFNRKIGDMIEEDLTGGAVGPDDRVWLFRPTDEDGTPLDFCG